MCSWSPKWQPIYTFTSQCKTMKTLYTAVSPNLSSDADTAEIEADTKVVWQLCDLECSLTVLLTNIRLHFEDCKIKKLCSSSMADFSGTEDFASCVTIEQIMKTLCHSYIDTFNVYY